MTRVGYVHFSSEAPDEDVQISRLEALVHEVVRSKADAGATRARQAELGALIQCFRAGDELVVLDLDHLGRSARDVLSVIHKLEARNAILCVLEPGITTAGDEGEIMVIVLKMIAELEHKTIKDRQRAGIEAGKAAGSYKGRLKSVDDDEIRRRVAAGESKAAIARAMNISRMTIYRAIGGA